VTVAGSATTSVAPEHPAGRTERLHYLDWLQVLGVFGVFLFHALHPFDSLVEWHIKNAERSALATLFAVFFTPWGMPFFFLMAGTTSWFSLRRRTGRRYVRERAKQLLIPFVVGIIVMTPIQAYLELSHRGLWDGSYIEFVFSADAWRYFSTSYHTVTAGPEMFGNVGYHLWFLAYLFTLALVSLPVFLWLKRDSGGRFIDWLAGLASRRGGLLVFVLPLIVSRFIFQPFFPGYTGWSDFFFMLLFFIFGYILTANEQFMRAIRRDWLLYLILGIACSLYFLSVAVGTPVLEWMESPGTPAYLVTWAVFSINAWCWTMVVLNVGMRFLDFSNELLQYSREASFPFFWIHHPVVFFVAFYVVRWDVHLLVKMLVVVVGSFALSLGFYEVFVRRINPVRAFFGMKPHTR
jgi:hypothetical protein